VEWSEEEEPEPDGDLEARVEDLEEGLADLKRGLTAFRTDILDALSAWTP